ncbi:protein E6-like [Salvia miltiorrhiza]|uniref:protein E6-like n=1 Tax=Salvia miltiorrhiza TaxID=226208 RepID=UPI0025AC000F|nr:protein E6-like [Salvia miltiorrhiza]
MASSTNQFCLFLLLLTLSSSLHTHARDSQFFNKASAIPTTATAVPDAQQPNFLPEDENSYGLYAHHSIPTAAQPHLPKNYNPVAYVTLPEHTNNKYNGGFNSAGDFQPQGMSDTRFLESGKYFYDLNTEKYSSNHPYEILREDQTRNGFYNKNFYGNSENAYEFNGEGYQTQDEFEDEVNNLP